MNQALIKESRQFHFNEHIKNNIINAIKIPHSTLIIEPTIITSLLDH